MGCLQGEDMRLLNFTYNGEEYGLDVSNQTVANIRTCEVWAVRQLRDLGLIQAVRQRVENAQDEQMGELIYGRMVDNMPNFKERGILWS